MGEDALPRTKRLRLRQSTRVRMSRTKATAPTTPPATEARRGLGEGVGEEDTVGEGNGDLEEDADNVSEGDGELVEGATGEEEDGGDVVGVTARLGLLSRLVRCVEAQRTSLT